jgi:hypothetical protein
MDLSRAILEYTANNNAEITKIILEALQFEAHKILN